ncbi:MAG: ATP-binding protein [Gemmatimonadaceae bacterium]
MASEPRSSQHSGVSGWHLLPSEYRELFEYASDAYLVTDEGGVIRAGSQASAALLGVPRHALENTSLALFLDEDARRDFPGKLSMLRGVRARRRWLLRICPRTGAPFDGSLTATAVNRPDGSLVGLRWEIHNIAAEHRLEEAQHFLGEASRVLAGTLDYYDSLATLAQLAVPQIADYCLIHEVEENGHIKQVSATAATSEKESMLLELAQLKFPDPADPRSLLATVLHTGEPVLFEALPPEMAASVKAEPRVLQILAALGPKSLIIVPLKARGHTIGAISLATSESGRQYGEHELELAEELALRGGMAIDNARLHRTAVKASQAKSNFLAVMSHELRTPLSAIFGYAELLHDEIVGPVNAVQKEQLGRIRASGEHLLELVEEILTFARMESRQERVLAEDVAVAELVDSACVLMEPLVRKKGLRFDVRTPDAGVRMETDRSKMRQILCNLLGNAIKFTDNGHIELVARLEQGRTIFEISDTGIGISPGDLDHVFDPFWQVEQSATRRAGGTGLGLSVARQLARLLGGDVSAESKVGEGSRFVVWMPAKRE